MLWLARIDVLGMGDRLEFASQHACNSAWLNVSTPIQRVTWNTYNARNVLYNSILVHLAPAPVNIKWHKGRRTFNISPFINNFTPHCLLLITSHMSVLIVNQSKPLSNWTAIEKPEPAISIILIDSCDNWRTLLWHSVSDHWLFDIVNSHARVTFRRNNVRETGCFSLWMTWARAVRFNKAMLFERNASLCRID